MKGHLFINDEDGNANKMTHLYSEILHVNLQHSSFSLEPRGAVQQLKCMICVQIIEYSPAPCSPSDVVL